MRQVTFAAVIPALTLLFSGCEMLDPDWRADIDPEKTPLYERLDHEASVWGTAFVPLAVFARSETSGSLSLRGPGGVRLGWNCRSVADQPITLGVEVTYLPLEQKPASDEGHAVIVDLNGSHVDARLVEDRRLFSYCDGGVSVMHNHLDTGHDMFGLGFQLGAGIEWRPTARGALGVFGKCHLWLGGGGGDFQTAGSLMAGANLSLAF